MCDPSYFKLFHLWIHQYNNHPVSRNSTHPPVFIAPRILVYRKMGVLYLNWRYLRIFDRFWLVVQSNNNRFPNGFHSRIAFRKLYNIAAQSLSRHKLCCIENNYWKFFQANSVSVRWLGCFWSDNNFDFTACFFSSNWTIWYYAGLSRSKIDDFRKLAFKVGQKLIQEETSFFKSL